MKIKTVKVKRGETILIINEVDLKEGEKALTDKQVKAEAKKTDAK